MLFLRYLMAAFLVSNSMCWGMEVILKKEMKELTRTDVFNVQDLLKKHQYLFEDFAKEIREKVFIEKDERWKTITNDKHLTKSLLSHVEKYLSPYTFHKNGFDYFIRNSQGFWRASAAAVLGMPGAIEFGRKIIEKNEDEKEHLKAFLFVVVRYGIDPQKAISSESCLAWSGEDFDVVKAALHMDIEREVCDYFGISLVSEAQKKEKQNIVDLLLQKNEVKLSPENFIQESV